MSLKISCTMIIRDESSTLRACLESIRPHVDELVIIDTGSTDDSPSIAADFADSFEVWTGCNDAQGHIADFSAARNRALEKASGDVLAWFDGDDLVRGASNLRKLVSEAYTVTAGQPFAWVCPYEYERDAAGRVVTLQWRERLVYPPAGWEWRGPVHEGLLGKAGTIPTYMQTDLVTVQHELRSSSKPRDPARNLRILDAYIRRVGEADQRSLHYLGAELMYNGRIGEAMYWFERHAQVAPWSDERCLSLLHLARIHFAMGHWSRAADWALQAVATKSWPEPYWLAGQAYCAMAECGIEPDYNLRRGAHMLQQGFRADNPSAQSLLMKDPTVRFDAHAWLAPALAKLGRVDDAIVSAEAGLAGKPEHTELLATLRALKRGKLMAGVAELEKLGAIAEHVRPIVEIALREGFKVEKIDAAPAASALPPRPYEPPVQLPEGKLRIAFYLGHQLEPWTPETLERDGMGGSETMAWEMSKRLAKLGHRVTVYGHLPSIEHAIEHGSVFENVTWDDSERFPHEQTDVLIVSRQAAAVALPHSAKCRVLWVHDVHCGPALTPEVAAKFDLIWCLSEWHRTFFMSCYPWLPPAKVEVTRNGIDPERFKRADITRNAHRAVYSSSPDRGLAAAVAAWPRVREAIPDAELHCFYGFENWERSLELGGENGIPHCSRAALTELKVAIDKTEGVFMHGRVNGKRLAEEMLASGVWFYPTWFSETSCITAMEAQAAGLVCVCPSTAALGETVDLTNRFWRKEDPASCVAEAMGPKWSTKRTDFSLDTLAADWNKRLHSLVDAVVPCFSEAAQ